MRSVVLFFAWFQMSSINTCADSIETGAVPSGPGASPPREGSRTFGNQLPPEPFGSVEIGDLETTAKNAFSSQSKSVARAYFEGLRRAFSAEVMTQKSEALTYRLLQALGQWSTRNWVALYAAESFELSLRGVFDELRRQGVGCVFPCIAKGTQVLVFREVTLWQQLEALQEKKILSPPASGRLVLLADIDLFLVPAVALTRGGQRLGRGGGFYDATLGHTSSRARRVGIALDCSVVEELPTEAHDISMDFIATESTVPACTTSGRRRTRD
jgi:5-formyltetrahydrofolate cyclo-ligase